MRIHWFSARILMLWSCMVAALGAASAQEPIALIGEGATGGWVYNNGPEFPGSQGGLTLEATAGPTGDAALRLHGDFTGGGGYVATYRETPAIDPASVDFQLRHEGLPTAIIRLEDASGQVHQIRYKLAEEDGAWQWVRFPVADFFKHRGTSRSVAGIQNYEYWGGAKDGKWHGPLKRLGILLSKRYVDPDKMTGTLWIGAPTLIPRVEREQVELRKTLELLTLSAGDETPLGWTYDPGREFKGAAGSLTVGTDATGSYMRLSGDFNDGGAYVQAMTDVDLPETSTVSELRLQLRSANVVSYAMRLIDGSGQVHQARHRAFEPGADWQTVTIVPADFAGGEHWGGANDGKWHGRLAKLAIMVNKRSDTATQKPVMDVRDVQLDATITVEADPPSLSQDFEAGETLPAGWQPTGAVSLASGVAGNATRVLRLSRTQATQDAPVSVVSAPFSSSPGPWEFSLRARGEMVSPDASFAGSVKVEFMSAAGKVVGSSELLNLHGTADWATVKQTVDAPIGTGAARLKISLNKAIGDFWLDDLAATRLVTDAFAVQRIDRVLFGTEAEGNLLLPEQPVVITAEVLCRKPLSAAEREVQFTLRDYWGVAQGAPIAATLEPQGRDGEGRVRYVGSVDLAPLQPALYQYYEVHIQVPQRDQAAFTDYTAFARLPEAVNNQYPPEQIPFTSRNWDNRIREYIVLSDRIGLRTVGIWGHWKSEPPYEGSAPRIDLAHELGMASISRVPTIMIEGHRGDWQAYTEEVMRAGTRRFLADFIPKGLTTISLGNEPRGTMERVKADVEAYRWVYEEVKKVDPAILCVGSSMGTDEMFFEAGQGKYLDVYDFHTYQPYKHLDRVFARYEEMFETYGYRKPIWCTEIGLNSQGMTRYDVANDMMKKLPYFFILGGQNVSWFGLLYPDPDGRSRGSSGDAHNVFEGRYRRYSPKLDAVMYYTMVNAISIKKPQGQQRYLDGVRAFHFRDDTGAAMQLWFSEGQRRDAYIPLPGVGQVEIVRVDSSRRSVDAQGQGITLTLGEEAVMLLYQDPADAPVPLPDALGDPALALSGEPPVAAPGQTVELVFDRGPGAPGAAAMDAAALALPPGWDADLSRTPDALRLQLRIPAATTARALQLRLHTTGELTVPITIKTDTAR